MRWLVPTPTNENHMNTPKTQAAINSCSIPIPRPLQLTCERLELECIRLRAEVERLRATSAIDRDLHRCAAARAERAEARVRELEASASFTTANTTELVDKLAQSNAEADKWCALANTRYTEIKVYKDAVDAQPWGTDEPIKALLDRVTRQWGDAKQGCNALNNLMRRVGWGQGEIDSAATVEEENERLRKVFCWALDYPKAFAETVSRLSWGPDAGKNMELAVTAIMKEMEK